jgi:hypothetical protein
MPQVRVYAHFWLREFVCMHAGQAGVKAIEITITMRQLRLVSSNSSGDVWY